MHHRFPPWFSTRHIRLFLAAVYLPFFFCASTNAQLSVADSLHSLLRKTDGPSRAYSLQSGLADFFIETNRDSALYFADNCIALAEKNNMLLDEAVSLSQKGHALMHLQQMADAYAAFNQALEIAENPKNNGLAWEPGASKTPGSFRLKVLSGIHHYYGNMIGEAGNTTAKLQHFMEALKIADYISDSVAIATVLLDLGDVYAGMSKPDSALAMELDVVRIFTRAGISRPLGYANMLIGKAYEQKNNHSLAMPYYYRAIAISTGFRNYTNLQGTYTALARSYLARKKDPDSAIYYIKKTLEVINAAGGTDYSNVYSEFAQAFQLKGETDSVVKYQGLAIKAKETAYNKRIQTLNRLQQLAIEEKEKIGFIQKREIETKNRFRVFAALSALLASCIVLIILYWGNAKKKKANIALEQAFGELKAAQAQLIQSAKMASLGELTSGIAHEIQNPLNFVNNFSEVNKEMIAELKEEISKGNYDEVRAIADDIEANEQKINDHGKRADAIVKGMLQHSRSSTGVKEQSDINKLTDEYLRLGYHGLRAKDKSFNATMKTDFDENIGKINIVPQDIGRVLLNLYNNAFYAVSEKNKQQPESYVPTVSVSTKKMDNKISITVSDNGNGIPQKIVDKIFQPFFTTKPTGQGTGLGLSLSYDIIKAHGGEIKVITKEGEGSVFVIELPLK